MIGVRSITPDHDLGKSNMSIDNWGFADVEAAVNTIPDWIKNVKWKGPDVDINRWLVSGHSNGGQGTWWALTHRPDKILAAAPVSGYASIQSRICPGLLTIAYNNQNMYLMNCGSLLILSGLP
jgi:poly(3-hydroxybutyrate) depolymerase